MPCIFHMLSRYILATLLEKIEVIVAISLIILENWSTTTKIASLSFDLGRGPITSMLISSHGIFGLHVLHLVLLTFLASLDVFLYVIVYS